MRLPWKRAGGVIANRRRYWQFWAGVWVALCAADLAYLRLIAPPNPVVEANYSKIHDGMSRQEVESILGKGWSMGGCLHSPSGLAYQGRPGWLEDGAIVEVFLGPDDQVTQVRVTTVEPSLLKSALMRLGL
jgi:hypothetical protein